jgi:hypothetical protein
LPRPASTEHSRVLSQSHELYAAVNRQRKIAELIRLGTTNSKNLWIACGATAFNTEVAIEAQAEILGKADSDATASADAAGFEFAQAEVAAAAAKERRGGRGGGTMPGADQAAAVKFVHLKKVQERAGLVQHHEKARLVLGALSPAWTELVICDVPGRGGGGES